MAGHVTARKEQTPCHFLLEGPGLLAFAGGGLRGETDLLCKPHARDASPRLSAAPAWSQGVVTRAKRTQGLTAA